MSAPPIENRLRFEYLYQPGGFIEDAWVEVDAEGNIVAVRAERPDDWSAEVVSVSGFAIPGVPNLHSHAFQRALVGRTESCAPDQTDSFWTWRVAMYQLALRITPEQLEAVAAQLYVEMLEGGFTSVGEFHYLHHDPTGAPYARPAELADRIEAAASHCGIALTHLPVLYLRGGFGADPLDEQRRFVHSDVESFLRTIESLRSHDRVRVGVAPHSLRAVGADALAALLELRPEGPVHIHIAEQQGEVEESVAHLGARPVQWLFDHADIDDRWCLVHATWCDDAEREALARSGAVAGLCPTTEANLGDGFFAARSFLEAGGRLGVGTDSQVGVEVAEELRLLEVGQRLLSHRRNVLTVGGAHPARVLLDHAVEDGNQALGQPASQLVAGRAADIVVLRADHPRLLGHGPETVLDAWIFGGAVGSISDVFVGGRRLVHQGRHHARDEIRARFANAIAQLWS